MLNFLIKLLGSKAHPRGPGFRRTRPHRLDLSGTRIEFSTPPHSDVRVPFEPLPDKYNIYDAEVFSSDPEIPNDLPSRILYTEGWTFFGLPLIQGRLGELRLGVYMIHNNRHGNLFNPDNFLLALNKWRDLLHAPGTGAGRKVTYLDWAVPHINGSNWVCFNTLEIDDLHNYATWVLPISEEHMLFFNYAHYVHYYKTHLNGAYRKLEDQIMASVNIDWSADAQRQKQAAAEKWPDAKLPEHMPPKEWPDSEWEKHAPKDPFADLKEIQDQIRREEEQEEARRKAG